MVSYQLITSVLELFLAKLAPMGLGQGTVLLFDYTLVSDLYFRVRDPTSKFWGLGQDTLQYHCSIIRYNLYNFCV